jgi:hypothetical protein
MWREKRFGRATGPSGERRRTGHVDDTTKETLMIVAERLQPRAIKQESPAGLVGLGPPELTGSSATGVPVGKNDSAQSQGAKCGPHSRRLTMAQKSIWTPLFLLSVSLLLAACTEQSAPTSPTAASPAARAGSADASLPEAVGRAPVAPSATSASPNAAQHTPAPVTTHPSQGPVMLVPGAIATLVTTDAGAQMTLRTSGLAPGHPHTVWFVAVNSPDQCASRPCTSADILFNTHIVQADVTYLTGNVVGNNGTAGFGGTIRAGALPDGWFGNGFTNPRGAEIHLILMDHGPKIPSLVANQISTLRGACTDASIPAAFPPAAFADGIPGPNTCRLVQVAIFQQ